MADNLESRMNFIVEQQALFATDIQLLKERQADTQRLVDANTVMIRQLVDVSLSLARHLEETDRRLGARIEQLAEAQTHTDRRLDAVIDIVDKLARRNGP
jgi:hypothetical protein